MTYQYRARDPRGNTIEGNLQAASVEEATQQLRRDGFQVVDIQEGDEGLSLFPKRVTKNEIIYVTAQLAIMVDTGITLSSALGGIVEQETNPTLRKVLADLRDAVEGGEDFSTALGRHPHLFDKTYRALVKASEASGTLGAMLDRISEYLRKQMETRGKVRAAMAYPMVMLVLACGVTIFLLTYILPKFTPLFKSRGTALPAPTRIMMATSDALLGYWYLWAAGAVAAVAGFIYLKRTEPGAQDPRLDQDQHADLRHHVPQGDHQPQHPHPGHDAGQRRAGDRGDPPGGRSVGQLLLRAGLGPRAGRSDHRPPHLRRPPRQSPLPARAGADDLLGRRNGQARRSAASASACTTTARSKTPSKPPPA